MSKGVYILFTFFLGFHVLAQDRYMVFFNDKSSNLYSIDQPEQFLSQKALQRREKQGISISEQDLPVTASYIQTIKDLGVEVFYSTKWMNGILVQMDDAKSDVVQNLSFVSSLEFVAPEAPLRARGSTKNDEEEMPVRPNLASNQQEMLGIDAMHEFGFYGKGVLIGVFDDGFQNITQLPGFQHIFEEDRILYGFDFVENSENVENIYSHGTRVLSIIAADQEDYIGGAPQATFILSVTEAPWEYRVEEYNWLFAAEKADSAGVDVISTSLGYHNSFTNRSMNYTNEQLDGETAVITKAANIAASKGIVLVNSAGNSGTVVSAPADSPLVLAVGAIDAGEMIANFSSRDTFTPNTIKPDVVARGVATLLVTAQGTIAAQNGTSFSAPLLTSLVAGVWEAYPNKTAEEVRELIRKSGDRANSPDREYGYGIPNFDRVMEINRNEAEASVPAFNAFPNPTTEEIQINFSERFFGEKVTIQLIKSTGKLESNYEFVPFYAYNPLKISLTESGLYFLRVITTSGSSTRKIIKY